MPAMTVGGLASGLDTNSIISQLTALEQAKVTREEKKKENAENSLEKFKELESKLISLDAKAKGLDLPKAFNIFKSTSNYEEIATASGGEGATAGQYELVVHELATAQKVASNAFDSIVKPVSDMEGWVDGVEKVTITLSLSEAARKADPTKKPVDVVINAGDSLKDIANKINAAEGAGVKASLMNMTNGETRLILTAVDTGTKGFYISESGGGNLLTDVLGIVEKDTVYTSADALLTKTGAANGNTTFDQLDTGIGKSNQLNKDDVMSVNIGGTQISVSLWDSTANGGAGGFKTVDQVLTELNDKIDATVFQNPNPRPVEPVEVLQPVVVLEPTVVEPIDEDDPDYPIYEQYLEDKAEYDQYEKDLLKYKQYLLDKDAWEKADLAYEENLDTSNLKLSLNNSGEIVLNGWPDNGTVPATPAERSKDTLTGAQRALMTVFEIKVGEGEKDDNGDLTGGITGKAKKSMGGFSIGNIFSEEINVGKNAFYTIDGMAVGSQSNDDDKTMTGTTFSLKKADPDKVVKISLELDKGALADKIAEFVEEFNELLKFIDENTRVFVNEETNEVTGIKSSKREVSAFTGDSAIASLRDNLKRMITGTINEIAGVLDNGYKTNYSSASRIGITTERDGYLSVDKEKLTKALDADFEGVRRLFSANDFSDTPGFKVGRFNKDSQTGVYDIRYNGPEDWEVWKNGEKLSATLYGDNILTLKDGLSFEVPPTGANGKVTFVRGIASQLSNFVEKAKNTVDGYFKTAKKTYENRIEEMQKRVDQLQRRVDSYNARMVSQFSSLERNMSNLQSQSANMMSALSSLTYGNNK